ncbi:MAG: YfhO family protein [bacterium]
MTSHARQHADTPYDAPPITRALVAAYVLLAVFMLGPAFIPGQQIAGSDYVTGGYYFLEFAINRMRSGHLPKWVPWVYGGVPMYSNPGGLFYPVRMLFSAILPVDRVMPAVYVVQFALAGIGMHVLARTLGTRQWVAFVAGVMFQFTGVTFSYLYAGHDGRIIGATLTPLVFYFVAQGVRTGKVAWFAGLSTTIGFILLSFQLQSAYYVLLGGGAWAVFLLVRARGELATQHLVRRAALGLAAVGFGFVLAAVNLLPFSGYVKDSPRAAVARKDFAYSTQFSMPPVETIGLAVPEQAGIIEKYRGANPFKLHTEYVGALVLLLLVIGTLSVRLDRVWQFMAGLTVFALTICYGSYTPFYSLYYKFLPGTSKFRSPSIALFLVSFALVTMAALTLEMLAQAADARQRARDRDDGSGLLPTTMLNVLVVLSVIALAVAVGTALDSGGRAIGWARFAVCFLLATLIVRSWTTGRLRAGLAAALLVVLTVVDLWIVDRNFLWTQPASDIAYAEDDVVRFLQTQPAGRVWVFPFPDLADAPHYMGNGRFPVNSDYLMHFGISQAGGEHGNQLYRWNRLLGLSKTGSVDWHNFVQYPAMMKAASVRYIVSGVPLRLLDGNTRKAVAGLREAFHGKAYVYANDSTMPRALLVSSVTPMPSAEKVVAAMRMPKWDPRERAYVESPASPLPPSDSLATTPAGTTQIIGDDPDRIEIRVHAERPALLVVSDNYADGWVAHIDGKEAPIVRTNLTFRGVPITAAGDHTVILEFRPRPLYAGLWISGGAWAVLVATLVITGVAAVRQRPVTGA